MTEVETTPHQAHRPSALVLEKKKKEPRKLRRTTLLRCVEDGKFTTEKASADDLRTGRAIIVTDTTHTNEETETMEQEKAKIVPPALFGGIAAGDTKGLRLYLREHKYVQLENGVWVGRIPIMDDIPRRATKGDLPAKNRIEHRVLQSMQHYIETNEGQYVMIDENNVSDENEVLGPEEELPSINTRFGYVESFVAMAAKFIQPSVIITGPGGVGKSYTITSVLENLAGMVDFSDIMVNVEPLNRDEMDDDDNNVMAEVPDNAYICIKGYSTALSLYTTLYHCRKHVVVLDDCDNIMKHPDGLNILKGALDTHPEKARYVSWQSGRIGDIPNIFKFEGSVIFISNLPRERIDQALRTRSMVVDLSMTPMEKLERMEHIVKLPSFMPKYATAIKQDVMAFVRDNLAKIRNINFRTLVIFIRLAAEYPDTWKPMAKFQIRNQG